ncbi:MAG: hypothetical protein KGO49_00720 [Gammaproteobacteria bacterium]|nr:hypothetical protein [Gammaproteobacteria bacterium]
MINWNKRSIPTKEKYFVVKTSTHFNLHGPIVDDTDWTNRICEAQKNGKDVTGEQVDDQWSEQAAIEYVSTMLRLEYTAENLLA